MTPFSTPNRHSGRAGLTVRGGIGSEQRSSSRGDVRRPRGSRDTGNVHLTDLLSGLAHLAEQNPVLLLAVLLGVGSIFGSIKVRGIGLGPAAVLFTALGLSAADPKLSLPQVVGTLGLALFAYTVGLAAGPTFFSALRTGGRAVSIVLLALGIGAVVTVVVGRALALSGPLLAGAFTGSLTNTPALAAASEQLHSPEPTVGYSVTYLFGVLGMIGAAALSLRGRDHADSEAEAHALEGRNVRIDSSELPSLGALSERYDDRVVFSRIMRGDFPGHPGTVEVATDDMHPDVGDILTVVGEAEAVAEVVAQLGHPSSVALTLDRSTLDFRRIAVTSHKIVGHTLGSLRLARRYGATATRVRRGDVDLLATDDLVLAPGDRVRVVAPRAAMNEISELLGDSERAAGDLNPVGLGLGLALGLLLGLVVFPLPGGTDFTLGSAGGPLLVGLVLGRLMRSGPIVWTLPHHVSATLNQLGMLMFLAYAGSNSGKALADALGTDQGPRLLALGVLVTVTVGGFVLVAGRFWGHLSPAALAGTVAGAATQPAVLAHANDATEGDPRANLGYAVVYPVAMIAKVILAPLIGTWG